jgi:hypothetical protein
MNYAPLKAGLSISFIVVFRTTTCILCENILTKAVHIILRILLPDLDNPGKIE